MSAGSDTPKHRGEKWEPFFRQTRCNNKIERHPGSSSSPAALIDRRVFLKSAGAAFLAGLSTEQTLAARNTDAVYASAYKSSNGGFGIATLSERGEVLHQYALPDRGHDIVLNPVRNQIVAFARRPGTFAAIMDPTRIQPPRIISCSASRHFYGHGVFSADGNTLYATENDFENAQGIIGVYNAADDFNRIGEFAANGIGPHDIELLPDGKTLVIANGGIETHPDFPRVKLNIATMTPNLSFIDAQSGALKASFQLEVDEHKLSIRHLTLLDDKVWFACQNEGDITRPKPLVGHISLSAGKLKLLDLPHEVNASLRGYVGSIAANPHSRKVAFTSPEGQVAYSVDTVGGMITKIGDLRDVCGVAPKQKGFALSSGDGWFGDARIESSDQASDQALAQPSAAAHWDNHLLAIKSV